jgi:tripartite-type tricarboxylate transporter receptor subunit TctC
MLDSLITPSARILAGAILFTGAAIAQEYPSKPIRLIVPTPAGGNNDFAARVIGPKLSEALGQPVVVDNRAGAGSNIGSEMVARAAPDGYTLLMAMSAQTINMSLYRNLSYNTLTDFAPVTMVVDGQVILVVHPSVPVKTVKELIAFAKSRPGQLSYASSGNGTTPHLIMEYFKSRAGVNILHVVYKGGSQAIIDTVAGRVDMMFAGMVQLPLVKGKLRALAVSSTQRSALAPEVPTVAEAGLPGFAAGVWQGILAPAGTPKDVIAKLYTATVRILKQPDVRERYASVGFEPVGSTPEAFGAFLKADIAKWSEVVKRSGAQVDN